MNRHKKRNGDYAKMLDMALCDMPNFSNTPA